VPGPGLSHLDVATAADRAGNPGPAAILKFLADQAGPMDVEIPIR
jgi:hypothetical protein